MGAFRRSRGFGVVRVAVAATLLVSVAASAQEGDGPINCDVNLQPAVETEAQREGRVACELHAGCRYLVSAVVRNMCRAADFFRKLSERDDPTLPVTSSDVADAATPEYPESYAADRVIANARVYANRGTEGRGIPGSMITTRDGRTAYAETQSSSDRFPQYRRGTVIYADGSIARGGFDQNGELYGSSQVVTPDGRLRAGSFSYGQLSPPENSVETFREPDGRTSILEGTFCGDNKPCNGEMVRRYSDGTSRREVWRGGVAVTLGQLAARGEVPPLMPLENAAPPPTPIWTPSSREGLQTSFAGEGREYMFVWCNGIVLDEGAIAEKGRALPPERRDCRQPGPDGLNEITDSQGRRRWELWCKGKVLDVGSWAARGVALRPLSETRCYDEQEDGDEEEVVQNDAIERTLTNGRIVPPPPRPANACEAEALAITAWHNRFRQSDSEMRHFETMLTHPDYAQRLRMSLTSFDLGDGSVLGSASRLRDLANSLVSKGARELEDRPLYNWQACTARGLADKLNG